MTIGSYSANASASTTNGWPMIAFAGKRPPSTSGRTFSMTTRCRRAVRPLAEPVGRRGFQRESGRPRWRQHYDARGLRRSSEALPHTCP